MACAKRSYSKKDALTVKNHRGKRHNGHALRVYRCDDEDHPGAWHLTHLNPERADRRDWLRRHKPNRS